MEDIVILAASRTPIGAFLGQFKDIPGPLLGAEAIRTAVERSRVSPALIDECLMGCVLTSGVGQAPARQAAIFAGLPQSVCCTTVNRVCGSGLKSVMLATQMIQTGDAQVVVAGGMESMSRAPFLLDKARDGLRLGNALLNDSIIQDGLWDVYGGIHMGNCAELCARERKFSRADQDRYARQSYERANHAIASGQFRSEMTSVTVTKNKDKVVIECDEEPGRANLEKFPGLKPAFEKEGTITAANASSLSDGAAALVLTSMSRAKELGLKPLARIVAQASHAQDPKWFTTAPVGAVKKLLQKTNREVASIDRFEINEAFSVVALSCIQELGLSEDRVNVRGGAVALGHPIGASGARILTTLLYTLIDEKKQSGIAAICIGGGEASSVLIERI